MATAEYHRNWYHVHKERLIPIRRERNRKHAKFIARVVKEFKLLMGCKECGYDKHPRALQFHHRDRSSKKFELSEGAYRSHCGLSKLLEEIDKCDVLCANCHAVHEDSIRESDSGNLRPSDG